MLPFFGKLFGVGAAGGAASSFGAKSLGAAENIPQLTREMINGSRIIAEGKKIRDVERLMQEYGGKARDWVKKSTAPMDINGVPAEIHWYECKEIGKVENKIKWLDEE